jgi:hypothetical protein
LLVVGHRRSRRGGKEKRRGQSCPEGDAIEMQTGAYRKPPKYFLHSIPSRIELA